MIVKLGKKLWLDSSLKAYTFAFFLYLQHPSSSGTPSQPAQRGGQRRHRYRHRRVRRQHLAVAAVWQAAQLRGARQQRAGGVRHHQHHHVVLQLLH